jgi:hypothetical protein
MSDLLLTATEPYSQAEYPGLITMTYVEIAVNLDIYCDIPHGILRRNALLMVPKQNWQVVPDKLFKYLRYRYCANQILYTLHALSTDNVNNRYRPYWFVRNTAFESPELKILLSRDILGICFTGIV